LLDVHLDLPGDEIDDLDRYHAGENIERGSRSSLRSPEPTNTADRPKMIISGETHLALVWGGVAVG
jgi:hypothetical protein